MRKTCAGLLALAGALGCGGPRDDEGTTPASPAASEEVAEPASAWSEPVDGLRGRLLASREGAALRLTLELQNVAAEPLEIRWSGRPDVGFATFALEDAEGREVPEPEWRLGGNEPGGELRELLAPGAIVSHHVPVDVFSGPGGARVLRIGAFWARELPVAGVGASLRARVAGSPATSEAEVVAELAEGGSVRVRAAAPGDPRGRAWLGPLDLLPVPVQ